VKKWDCPNCGRRLIKIGQKISRIGVRKKHKCCYCNKFFGTIENKTYSSIIELTRDYKL